MSKYIENDIDRDEGGTRQLSADEIAVALGTYLEKNAARDDRGDNRGSEEIKESEKNEDTGSERNLRRQQRLQEMRRRKRQQERMRRLLIPCAVVFMLCVIFAGMGIRSLVKKYTGRQQGSQIVAANDGDVEDGNAGEDTSGQDDIEDTDSGKNVSNKDISYDGRLNVAGCDPGSTVADSINEEIAQITTLFVRTLGGKNHEPPLRAVADEMTAWAERCRGTYQPGFHDEDSHCARGGRAYYRSG